MFQNMRLTLGLTSSRGHEPPLTRRYKFSVYRCSWPWLRLDPCVQTQFKLVSVKFRGSSNDLTDLRDYGAAEHAIRAVLKRGFN
jgi:hypothetical protein